MLIAVKSGESAKHDADHGDENPAGGAGFGLLVVAHQPPVLHQPAERTLHHPALGQHLETAGVIAALDDFHFQFGALGLDPRGEILSGGRVLFFPLAWDGPSTGDVPLSTSNSGTPP